MAPSFVSAPPSNELVAQSKSSLQRTTGFYSVYFNGLLLLARWRSLSERDTYSSGWCGNEADRFSLPRTHVS